MGYNTRPEMILENVDLLASIKAKIEAGQEIRLRVPEGANISQEQYRLRRLLAATDNHRTAYGGTFAGLGAVVLIRNEPATHSIIVRPRKSARLEEYKPDEKFALDALEDSKGSITILEFWPTADFNFEAFSRAASGFGWRVIAETREVGDDGKLTFAAERVEEEDRAFSLGGDR